MYSSLKTGSRRWRVRNRQRLLSIFRGRGSVAATLYKLVTDKLLALQLPQEEPAH